MLEFHQFDRASELLRDTVLQLRASERKRRPLRGTDMGRQRLFRILIKTLRPVQKKFGKPACGKPRKATIVVEATKRKAPISLQTVPAKKGGVRCDTSHGFDRIPHEFMNISEANNHRYWRHFWNFDDIGAWPRLRPRQLMAKRKDIQKTGPAEIEAPVRRLKHSTAGFHFFKGPDCVSISSRSGPCGRRPTA